MSQADVMAVMMAHVHGMQVRTNMSTDVDGLVGHIVASAMAAPTGRLIAMAIVKDSAPQYTVEVMNEIKSKVATALPSSIAIVIVQPGEEIKFRVPPRLPTAFATATGFPVSGHAEVDAPTATTWTEVKGTDMEDPEVAAAKGEGTEILGGHTGGLSKAGKTVEDVKTANDTN